MVFDYLDYLHFTLFSAFIGMTFKMFRNRYRIIKKNKFINLKRELRLRLTAKKIYSREEIVEIGRKALRCSLTSKILTDPMVYIDGKSYEKELITEHIQKLNSTQDISDLIYPNRVLKEFISNFYIINN